MRKFTQSTSDVVCGNFRDFGLMAPGLFEYRLTEGPEFIMLSLRVEFDRENAHEKVLEFMAKLNMSIIESPVISSLTSAVKKENRELLQYKHYYELAKGLK